MPTPRPPFCPNADCRFNTDPRGWRFKKKGFFLRDTAPQRIQRYRCSGCHRSFSSQTFALTYWLRRPDLPRIKSPTIVVCGRDDAATPLFLSEEIAKAIPAAALVVVDQCGHLVTMEKPEEANLILKTWLDR